MKKGAAAEDHLLPQQPFAMSWSVFWFVAVVLGCRGFALFSGWLTGFVCCFARCGAGVFLLVVFFAGAMAIVAFSWMLLFAFRVFVIFFGSAGEDFPFYQMHRGHMNGKFSLIDAQRCQLPRVDNAVALALAVAAGGASGPVNVFAGFSGKVHIDDMGNIGNVQAAGGQIGGHQNFDVAIGGSPAWLSAVLLSIRCHGDCRCGFCDN